ncbi:MAG: SH3 domain-containing protein [Candidatus Pelethousia sp.]|nr:SH3 domain-containing protein [Candidatus Pelethousia sp.]
MRRSFLRPFALALVLALLLMFLPGGSVLAANNYSYIKVKLSTNNATALTIYATGSYFVAENGVAFTGGTISLRSNYDGTMTLNHSSLGDVYTGKSISLMRAKMDKSAGYLQLNGYRYLGHFYLSVLSSSYLRVVNEVPLAHYLYGVVGYEMSDTFPIEALKAQAIAAKCYALSLRSGGSYDLGDTSSDQVYKGYNAGYTNVIAAVDSTLNEVLTVNGSLLTTYYAASNGGETMLPSQAWSGRSNAGYAVNLDPYDLRNIYSKKETITVPLNQGGSINQGIWNLLLTKASATTGQSCTSLSNIASFSLHTPRYSGQSRNMTAGSATVSVVTASGALLENVNVTFATSELETYRAAIDSSLRIFWGEPAANGSSYYIYHVRYGHGVGLSQRGAQQAASEGLSYRQILSFYYPGASLASISVENPTDPVNAGTTNSQPGAVVAKTTGNVRLRAGAGTSFEEITTIPKGADIYVYDRENGWAHASYGSYTGYVSEKYVDYISGYPTATPTPTPNPSATPAPTAAPGVIAFGVVTGQGVNFRTGPSTGYSSLTKLNRNTSLDIYGQESGWYKAAANGQPGYIISSYVSITGYPALVPESNANDEQPAASPTPIPTGIFWSVPTTTPTPQATMGLVTPTPSADPYSTVLTGLLNTSNVNFRMGPATSYGSLGKLKKDTGVFVLGQEGDWYKVFTGGRTGYVYSDYITLTGTARIDAQGNVEGAPPAGSTGLGKTTGKVYLRKGPGTSYEKLSILKADTELTLYGTSDGWYKVKLSDGTEGYVSSKYVTVTQSYTSTTSPVSTGATGEQSTGKGVTTTDVNFRQGPSTSTKKLGRISAGSTVTLYDMDGDWYHVEYNGTKGYIYGKYINKTVDSGATIGGSDTTSTHSATDSAVNTGASVQLAVGSAGGKVNLRKGPSTSTEKLELLPKGTELNILGQCGDWYYVLYKGQAAFASKSYIRVESQGTAGIPEVNANISPRVCATTAQVNMRTGANTSSSIITLLQRRAQVTVYYVLNGWCLVSYNGVFGYVTSDYVNLG